MKLFVGWVATVGLLATAASADAEVLLPLRIGGELVTSAARVAGATISAVSDFGGPYAAMPPEAGPRYALQMLPPREIFAIVRESGFEPLGALQQRGVVYTMAAIDPDGEDGRLVIDARSGRILRFVPAYRMGGRMGEELTSSYGPEGAYRPGDAPPFIRDDRRSAQPPTVLPHVASRTPTVPLPKASPPRAVATPAKPVAPAPAVAVAPAPVATPDVPATQQAVVAPKPDEVRVIPLDAGPAAAPATTPAAAPTVAAPPVEARPAAPASETMPPVQGLD
jgi:hypothetical protein